MSSLPSRVLQLVGVVAADHGLTPTDVLEGGAVMAAHARYDCWWRLRTQARPPGARAPSYPQIAAWFGKDHSTVIYGVKRWTRHVEDHLPLLQQMLKEPG